MGAESLFIQATNEDGGGILIGTCNHVDGVETLLMQVTIDMGEGLADKCHQCRRL